jgi:hypothetical protein
MGRLAGGPLLGWRFDLVLHLLAPSAEFVFRRANGCAKLCGDVAGHAADASIPDTAHTPGV